MTSFLLTPLGTQDERSRQVVDGVVVWGVATGIEALVRGLVPSAGGLCHHGSRLHARGEIFCIRRVSGVICVSLAVK